MYILKSGEVLVFVLGPQNEMMEIATLRKGNFFGEMAIFRWVPAMEPNTFKPSRVPKRRGGRLPLSTLLSVVPTVSIRCLIASVAWAWGWVGSNREPWNAAARTSPANAAGRTARLNLLAGSCHFAWRTQW
jgi:hypothetical protein